MFRIPYGHRKSNLVSDRKKEEEEGLRLGDLSSIERWTTCTDAIISEEEFIEIIRKAGFHGIEYWTKNCICRKKINVVEERSASLQ